MSEVCIWLKILLSINTRGSSCAALAIDFGEGTLNVNSQINTCVDNSTGKGSLCIYSKEK